MIGPVRMQPTQLAPARANAIVPPAGAPAPMGTDGIAAPRSAATPALIVTAPGIVRHTASGPSVTLKTTPPAAARIAAGLNRLRSVDGVTLAYPNQDLRAIESADPLAHGQTHSLTSVRTASPWL